MPPLAQAADRADAEVARAEATHGDSERVVAEAEAALDQARRRELVHAVSEGLHAGDDCPVCGTELAEDPSPAAEGTATAEATARLATARDERKRSEAALGEARRTAAIATEQRAAAERRIADARAARGAALTAVGADDDAAADALLDRVRRADDAVTSAQTADREARTAEAAARADRERAGEREQAAWAVLDRARDSVARLGPPTTDRRDLATDWRTLLAWADRTRPVAVSRADEAAAAVLEARRRYAEINASLRDECASAAVEVPPGGRAGEAVAEALATARAQRDTLADRVAQVAAVTTERAAADEEATVAEQLGKLLRADGFSRWLLARALTRLVSGASELLRELSSGAYSLALDGTNQFLVVDHRNADEPRTVKSLSGGERFLASLALALALADHVADLAADGAARLESLFLDEGFGTLDPDTLDVVAAALEELGARGRVVGIVTHVHDLAERLPVRFEVRKGPRGSTVRRVDDGAPTEDAFDPAEASEATEDAAAVEDAATEGEEVA
jgi:DNA repair protein SbcC/Rad50